MKVIENSPDRLIIRMEANEPLANSLRRSVSEVPTLAIDEVEIFKNDSALYDELLAHRIGLVPLKTDKKMNEKTAIDFKLTAKGPGVVYAEELQGNGEIVQPKIPLTILGTANHKLELVATARLGIGREHAKYIPGLCFYRHLLEIKSSPHADKIIESSRGGLIVPEKKGSKWVCDISEAEVDQILERDKEAVSTSEEFLFVIESYGNMPAKEILAGSAEALMKNLKEFEDNFK